MGDRARNSGLGQKAEQIEFKAQKPRFFPNSGEPSKIFSKERCKILVYDTCGDDQVSCVAKLHFLACARWLC